MHWYCYAIYGERGKPICYVAEQEDVTGSETLRLKERLLAHPQDPEATQFFAVLNEFKEARRRGASSAILPGGRD